MRAVQILRSTALATAVVSVPCAGAAAVPADKGSRPITAPMAWRDLDGREHPAVPDVGLEATVLVFSSTTCPCADEYTPRVRQLAREHAGKARFFLVLPGAGETEAGARAYAASRRVNMPVVLDAGGRLAERLKAEVTPTAVLLDAAGTVRYAGRIDDSPDARLVKRAYLRESLADVLAGRAVRHASTLAFGCAVAGEAKDPAAPRPVRLLPGLGEIRFTATTKSEEAQKFFRQGLALWYGFNFDEAERSFREAARLDPECAMAHWGMVLSLGMNYNWDFDPAKEAEVYRISRRALELAPKASERERLLIHALAKRHTNSPNPDPARLLQAYAAEMKRLAGARPEDVDTAVLAAAAAMDLRPWDLWTADGKPQPGTIEIVETLEAAVRKDPDHIGAHHLLIHAVEASAQPERAIGSARRLGELAPGSGHLVHMPAHIYQRVGDFRAAAKSNRDGADVDARFIGKDKIGGRYVAYYIHNLDFLAYSHAMGGRYEDALAAARELAEVIARYRPIARAVNCPSASLVSADVLVRFGRWDEILKAPEPAESDLAGKLFDVYARGVALVARGDLSGAEKSLRSIDAAEATIAPAFANGAAGTPYAKAGPLLVKIARSVLAGKIALAKGDLETAVRAFRAGIEAEDQLPYAEPAMWRSPVREVLGGALLRAGRAAEAEAVFREDLKRNRGNGRSLFGLMKSLTAQGRASEAREVERECRKAWEHADVRLSVEAL